MRARAHRLLLTLLFFAASAPAFALSTEADEKAAREINQRYVQAWLANDEQEVMNLFDDSGSITPGGLRCFKGKDQIRQFWFPKDSSVTTIEKFTNEIVYLKHLGEVIVITSNSRLLWSYKKGETSMAKDQEGYALTFLRKQSDGRWKIWKQIWSDLWAKDR